MFSKQSGGASMAMYRIKMVNARQLEAFPFRYKLQRKLFGDLWFTVDWFYGLSSAIEKVNSRCAPRPRVSIVVYEKSTSSGRG